MPKKNNSAGNKITEKQFRIFKSECEYWVRYFGLYGWEINYVLAPSDNLRAWCRIGDLPDRCAEIGIASEWGTKPTEELIKRSAFHEVVELLTMRIYILAVDRESCISDITEENHNLVRTLERVIFDKHYSSGKK